MSYSLEHKRKEKRTTEHSDFILRYEESFARFLKESSDMTLTLAPMNSFQRRSIHKLAADFHLVSRSEGEDEARHVIVEKTDQSRIPPIKSIPVWNFGDKEFFVSMDGKEGTEIVLHADGTVGISGSSRNKSVLTRRLVKSGSFKIKFNAILEFTDPDW